MSHLATSIETDHGVLDAWLCQHIAGAVAPFELQLIAGGHSNLTYLVHDGAGRQLVLRRPPMGHVLQSAHDVAREHRLISALAPTPLPVPQALALCEEEQVIGAPFYVMDFVEGVILRHRQDVDGKLDESACRAASDSLIDCLACLHSLDPDGIGLGNLSRKEGYIARQLRRWKAQFDSARTRDVPLIDEVHGLLESSMPQQLRTAIVHGDYRLDNCIVGPDGPVRAVLDWELCTLGDPLADLGLLMVYWTRPGDSGPELLTGAATAMPGFRERDELVARYVARTGADVSRLDFYIALGYWKLACIFEGVRARYDAGVMGTDGIDAERFATQTIELAEAALRTLKG